MEKLFLIDAYALIFKFYYAFINRPMRNSNGLNTSAIYGFTKFINDIIKKEHPKYFGVAFDPKGGNFRHQMYSLYKANRSETPEDIVASIPYIKQILSAMKIPILEIKGYEADDVIGTVAKMAAKKNLQVFMVTPDKDYGQLIEDNICMYKPRKGGDSIEIVTKDIINKYYHIDNPIKVIDILALWGDASDNVPGVPGIGEKSAIKLISEFGSIDNIFSNIESIKGKQKENLIEYKDRLMLARELVTICLNVPVELNLDELTIESPDKDRLIDIYREMNFATLIHDIEISCGSKEALSIEQIMDSSPKKVQNTLFGDEMFDDNIITVVKEAAKPSKNIINAEPTMFFEENQTQIYSDINSISHNYILVDSQKELDMLITLIRLKTFFCFDTETTGLNPISDKLVGISVSLEKRKAYYIPIIQYPHFLESLKPIFYDKNIAKIGQNIKFDLLVLKNNGIEVNGRLFDTMILQYLINSDDGNGMDYMARKYLNYSPISIENLIGKGAKQITMDIVDIQTVKEYACEDADITLQLYEILWKEIEKNSLVELYENIEEPLIPVLVDMEYYGIMVDSDMLGEYAKELQNEIDNLEINIKKATNCNDININSPKQLGELLFDRLKIIDNPKKTKTKQYKTDEEYLLSLRGKHEVVDMILEYRGVKKLLSTYVLAIPELINPQTGRVHTTYNQALTRTGRLSSTNPNLQNIPIRDPRGEVIRKAFIAQNSDNTIVSADYSQVELRIMAHLSKDSAMIEAFNNNEDIHSATAAKIYNINIEQVTKEQRSRAKSANFGIIYGISPFGLAQNLNISRTEAKELIDNYFKSYPMVKEYMEEAVETAKKTEYAQTIFGRKRFLKDINSSNAIVRSFAQRNAINAPIQGSAADIIKIAMSRLHKSLKDNKLESKITLQVHDELVLEVKKTEEQRVKEIVKQSMEGAVKLSVKLLAEAKSGKSWFDAH